MKSIKPGRGPSAMGAVGSVVVGIFGVFWTIGAASMGAPPFFILFGIVFVGLAVFQGIFHFKKATGTNRMSMYDITDHDQEPDPLNPIFTRTKSSPSYDHEEQPAADNAISYCPFCGNKILDQSHLFCSKCGKEIRN